VRAMIFSGAGSPLREMELPEPEPGPGQVRLTVHACAVCRTDLHIVDGELVEPKLPLVLGHQIVSLVSGLGKGASRFSVGERVGLPWLGWTDGTCRFCRSGRENLCDRARLTGYQIDGGFAEETVADERYCFRLPESYSDLQVAPLLCAGLIGYRSLVMAGDAERLGLYGFGASAHIVAQGRAGRGAAFSPSRVPATTRASASRARSERSGPGARPRSRRKSWTRRSSSHRSARSFPRR
jgi:alcohol dehydrogenase, propanol-preferring